MSRTDKDRPYRVRDADFTDGYLEHHDHRETPIRCITGEHEVTEPGYYSVWLGARTPDRTYTTRTWYMGTLPAVCDIDKPKHGRFRWSNNSCYRESAATERGVRRWHSPPPKWFKDHIYHNPMRRDARDVLRGAAREYNTYGETDADENLTVLHGSGAWWLWT